MKDVSDYNNKGVGCHPGAPNEFPVGSACWHESIVAGSVGFRFLSMSQPCSCPIAPVDPPRVCNHRDAASPLIRGLVGLSKATFGFHESKHCVVMFVLF